MELPAKKQEKNDKAASINRYSVNDFKAVEKAGLYVQHTYVSHGYHTHTHDFNETVISVPEVLDIYTIQRSAKS